MKVLKLSVNHVGKRSIIKTDGKVANKENRILHIISRKQV
jgi:hypothetical protein